MCNCTSEVRVFDAPRNDWSYFAARAALSPGLAAAGGFGLVDRAEPARALGDFHLDLRIPAAGRLVVDAFAGAGDVALDGAIGGGGARSGGRGLQDRMRILRRLGGAEDGGLLVADPPVPGCD